MRDLERAQHYMVDAEGAEGDEAGEEQLPGGGAEFLPSFSVWMLA